MVSIGGAAADGLTSGLNLGLSIANSQRQQARQDVQDQQLVEDRQRAQARQDQMDQGAALTQQGAALATEATGYAANPDSVTPQTQADFTGRVQKFTAARDAHLSRVSGVVTAAQQQAPTDINTLSTSGVTALPPGGLTRAITVATSQPPSAYLRGPGGAPSPIEQAGQSFVQGVQNNDPSAVVKGANVLFTGQLTGPQAGIGQASPYGGTIVRKEIVGMVPAPNSDPQNPSFIPTIRTYVNQGDKFMGPHDTDTSTGYYDAPMTQGRSSDPDAKVQAISMKDGMDFVGQNLHLAELLNQPEGLAQLQKDQQAGPGAFDAAQYLHALNAVGVSPQKATVTNTVVPEGASLVTQSRDSQGRLVSTTTTQPTTKPVNEDPAIAKRAELALKAQEAAQKMRSDAQTGYANGTLTKDQLTAANASADALVAPYVSAAGAPAPAAAAAPGGPTSPTLGAPGPFPARTDVAGTRAAGLVLNPPGNQAARDADALGALQRELAREQSLVPSTVNTPDNPHAVETRAGNIVALQNEINRTKATAKGGAPAATLGAPTPAAAGPTLGAPPTLPTTPAAAVATAATTAKPPATPQASSAAASAAAVSSAGGDSQLHGEAYLATLSPQVAGVLRQIANGNGDIDKLVPMAQREAFSARLLQYKPDANLTTGQAGARESQTNQRIMIAGNAAALDLSNVVKLPLSSDTGLFGGRKQGPGLLDALKEDLTNKMTSQDAQDYNLITAGFNRSLGGIEAAGMVPPGSLVHQMDAVQFKEGDSQFTKLEKLAQTRQIAEGGLDVLASNPRIPQQQRQKINDIIGSLQKSVPYTVADVLAFRAASENNPDLTLNAYLKANPSKGFSTANAPAAAPAAAPTTTPSGATVTNW